MSGAEGLESLTDAKVSEALAYMREESDRRIEEILNEQDRTRRAKKLFLHYYEKTLSVERSCQYAHITRRTYQNWLKRDPLFRNACLHAKQYELEMAEDHLRLLMLSRKEASIIFYLRTHHPDYRPQVRIKVVKQNSQGNTWRYCEKCEINHKGGICPKEKFVQF